MGQNGVALGLTFLAGSATIIGGLLALFLRKNIKPIPFAGALGFAGGVMTFVSFIEIYKEGEDHLVAGYTKKWAPMPIWAVMEVMKPYAMLLFFAGWIIASILDGILHLLLDAHDERRSANKEANTSSTDIQAINVPLSSSSRMFADFEAEATTPTEKKSPGCCRRFVDSKYLKAFLGTEEIEKGAKLVAEKQFHADCHRITRLGYFTAFVLAVHNIPEGIATFTGGAADTRLGVGLAIAIGIHNIPEGLAVAVPILFGTGSTKKALWYTFISGMAEPLGGLLAWWAIGDEPDSVAFGVLFLLTAGIMVNVALKELVFAAIRYDNGNRITSVSFFIGMFVMAISLIALDMTE